MSKHPFLGVNEPFLEAVVLGLWGPIKLAIALGHLLVF